MQPPGPVYMCQRAPLCIYLLRGFYREKRVLRNNDLLEASNLMFWECRLCQLAAACVCSTRVAESSDVLFCFKVVFRCWDELTILIPLKLRF